MDINDTIIIKFLNGECNTAELRAVQEWLDADATHADALFRLESVHRCVGASAITGREVSQHLREVHRRIDAADRVVRRRIGLHIVLRRAAVIVGIILLGALAYWLADTDGPLRGPKMMLAKATGNHPRLVRLADGSSVWLKAGSQLRYPVSFQRNERRVELKGEGYFEVTKNRHRPFVVAGGPVDVKVLGTKFDFTTDHGKQMASVSLIEGSVEVRDVKRDAMLLLKPNQRVTVNTRTGYQKVENMDTRIVAAWHDHLIPFTNANISEIARTVEQLYGVQVHVSTDVDNTQTYSGAVYLANNIDSVLSLIRSTVPISYHRKGNTVWIYKENGQRD